MGERRGGGGRYALVCDMHDARGGGVGECAWRGEGEGGALRGGVEGSLVREGDEGVRCGTEHYPAVLVS